MQQLWLDTPIGPESPQVCQAFIEVPQGSSVKYEIDKQSGLIRVDRLLSSAVHYPANYGFFPQTYCEDNDPLDVLVVGAPPLVPLAIVDVRPIGVIRMIDGGEADDKIIAVLQGDPDAVEIRELEDLPPMLVKRLEQFFRDYKNLEKKAVEITAVQGKEMAYQIIQESMGLFQRESVQIRRQYAPKA